MNAGRPPLFERLAGSTPAQRLLTRIGLDSRQFIVFLRLLRTLSERQEFMGNLGVNRVELTYVALIYAVFIGTPMGLLVFLGLSAPLFLFCNLSMMLMLIVLVLVGESANTLYNPVEASVLAHNPVDSLTYAAAKIAHVMLAVLYLVPALAVPSAILGLRLREARWIWPLTHLAAAFLAGLFAAFLICALYGWMFRYLPAGRLKNFSLWLQLLPFAAMPVLGGLVGGSLHSLRGMDFDVSRWTWMPLAWFVELGLLGSRNAQRQFGWQGLLSIGATAIVVWFGLRSFSGTYFSEASSIVRGRSGRSRLRQRFHFAAMIRKLTGSPAGLGAFSFTSKMMRRDWHFRRTALPTVVYFLFAFAPFVSHADFPASPMIPHTFSFALVVPHVLGLMLLTPCAMVVFTDLHRGSWIFLTSPLADLRAFTSGVYWAFWFPGVGVTHLCILPVLIRYWGWRDALVFAGFSLILVSFYLGLAMLLISGIPFSNPFKASTAALGLPVLMLGGMVAAFFATLQWVVFQIWWVAIPAGLLLGIVTMVVARLTLRHLEEEIRLNLQALQTGPTQMFKSIE